jgi:hypothetical protein
MAGSCSDAVVRNERYIAADNDFDIAAASLSIAAHNELDVAATTYIDAATRS